MLLQVAVQYWNKQALLHVIAATESHKNKIKEVDKKFDKYSKEAEKEVNFVAHLYKHCNTLNSFR